MAFASGTSAPVAEPVTPPASQPTPLPSRRRINVALQGGGALGAFSWGVLDALLETPDLDIVAVSGASAGALNAAALTSGLAQGSRETARSVLTGLWRDIGRTGSRGRLGAFAPWGGGVNWMSPDAMGRAVADLIAGHIHLPALGAPDAPAIIVSATELASEEARLFRGGAIDQAVLMASCALPHLHRPVTIEGRDYVDGGVSLNPPLMALLEDSDAAETLLVRIMPKGLPGQGLGLFTRTAENFQLLFNRGLIGELDQWARLQKAARQTPETNSVLLSRIRDHQLTEIDGATAMGPVSLSQSLAPSPALIETLFEAGRQSALTWLAEDTAERQAAAAG